MVSSRRVALACLFVSGLLACGREEPAPSSTAPIEPVALEAAPPPAQSGPKIRGRLVDHLARAAVDWEIGLSDEPRVAVPSSASFELVRPSWQAGAPVFYLKAEHRESGRRVFATLPMDAWPESGATLVIPEQGDRLEIKGEPDPRLRAWLDAWRWSGEAFRRWQETKDLDESEAARAHERLLADFAREIEDEADPQTRDLMRMLQFVAGRAELSPARAEVAKSVLDDFGLEDPRWAIEPGVLMAAIHASGRRAAHAEALADMISTHPQPELSAYIMLESYVEATHEGNWARAESLWKRWGERPALHETFYAPIIESYGPTRALAPGRVLARSCGAGEKGQARCFPEAGRLNLIEFWATYCSGCVAQMPALRSKVESLRAEGIDLAVFSVDPLEGAEHIAPFVEETRLPGALVWYPNEQEAEAFAAKIELLSVPRLVLTDGEGRVLASDPQLELSTLDAQVRHWAELQARSL